MYNFKGWVIKRTTRTGAIKVLSRKITRLELLRHETFACKAHHLPQMSCRGVQVVFLVGRVFKQLATNDKLEHLNISTVRMCNWNRWKRVKLPDNQMSKYRLSHP